MKSQAKGTALFQLIRSFSHQEKRLFRRITGQNLRLGKNNLLNLFNALDKMEKYDEEALVAELGDPAFIRNLPSHTTRLFGQLTDFLIETDPSPGIEAQLDKACKRIEILQQRGLNPAARKELKRATQLAQAHGKYLKLLRLADLERGLFLTESSKAAARSIESIREREANYLARLSRQIHLKHLHLESKIEFKTGGKQAKELIRELEEAIGKSIGQFIEEAEGTTTDMILLDTIGLCSQSVGDFDSAYAAYSKMDALWSSSADMIAENPRLYVSFMVSFLNACMIQGKDAEFRKLITNLGAIRFEKEGDALDVRESILFLELVFCLNRGDYDRGLKLEPEIESLLQRQRGRMQTSRTLSFYFNLCSLHFMQGAYSKANRWLAGIIHMPEQDYRRDIQAIAPVFQLVLFAAMDDRALLTSRLRSRLRARATYPPTPFENIIMTFAAQFLRSTDPELPSIYAQFKHELDEFVASTPSGIMTAAIGECLFWAEAKLRGTTPGQVFREKLHSTAERLKEGER